MMKKLLYKPLSLTFGVIGGLAAGVIFKQIWKLATGDDDVPDADDLEKGWGEVLAAAAVQGAIFALVKAAIDRSSAKGIAHLTS
jgi:hypothetical protein